MIAGWSEVHSDSAGVGENGTYQLWCVIIPYTSQYMAYLIKSFCNVDRPGRTRSWSGTRATMGVWVCFTWQIMRSGSLTLCCTTGRQTPRFVTVVKTAQLRRCYNYLPEHVIVVQEILLSDGTRSLASSANKSYFTTFIIKETTIIVMLSSYLLIHLPSSIINRLFSKKYGIISCFPTRAKCPAHHYCVHKSPEQ